MILLLSHTRNQLFNNIMRQESRRTGGWLAGWQERRRGKQTTRIRFEGQHNGLLLSNVKEIEKIFGKTFVLKRKKFQKLFEQIDERFSKTFSQNSFFLKKTSSKSFIKVWEDDFEIFKQKRDFVQSTWCGTELFVKGLRNSRTPTTLQDKAVDANGKFRTTTLSTANTRARSSFGWLAKRGGVWLSSRRQAVIRIPRRKTACVCVRFKDTRQYPSECALCPHT